ncbi:uncharacterized protein LOC121242352 [Juglans microcarpa x Juglans regia]|uniref:uncharacterized protein LOC121242352 n=1 Tax=Juglans microcarpa x Juglans regia TaxID=2249226 RepID=UPI001B7E6072|nr:uncharacterized protein LOC121242352 [Juglans microcarpa x Juglans regia]
MGFIISEAEMSKAVEDLRFALVLKFLRQRPSIDRVRLAIVKTRGLLEIPTVSFMDNYHVLVQMGSERDFVHGWAREGRTMDGYSFRIFCWTREFDLKAELDVAAQWVFLLGLPMHLYRKDCLQSLASRFGRYLATDQATLARSRATGARICVELNLSAELVQGFPIVVANKKIWQPVKYEKLGYYCEKCRRSGHTSMVCRVGQQRGIRNREERVGPDRNEGKRKMWREKQKDPVVILLKPPVVEELQEDQPSIPSQIEKGKEIVRVVENQGGKDVGVVDGDMIDGRKEVVGQGHVVENSPPLVLRRSPILDFLIRDDENRLAWEVGGSTKAIDEAVQEKGYDSENGKKALATRLKNKSGQCPIIAIAESFVGEDKLADLARFLGFTNLCSNASMDDKLWLLWQEELMLDMVDMTDQVITVLITKGSMQVLLSLVYAKCRYVERRELWNSLRSTASVNIPWLVAGDFNIICNDGERIEGAPRLAIMMNEFNECLDSCGLMDLLVKGRLMTWCNGHQGCARSWARLDRVVMKFACLETASSVFVESLSRKLSDHAPLLVKGSSGVGRYGPTPFRFQNMWLPHSTFLKEVELIWKESELEERIEQVDFQLQSGFQEELEMELLVLKAELNYWERNEEIRLSQIAKKKWLEDGD